MTKHVWWNYENQIIRWYEEDLKEEQAEWSRRNKEAKNSSRAAAGKDPGLGAAQCLFWGFFDSFNYT
jgi:hypothetical protein